MLGKSSVLMMLLVGTGSLVGISSIYIPANVETQPQQQPQPTPQPQKPQTTGLQGGITTPQSTIVPGQSPVDQRVLRAMEENQLLNRQLPKIVERLQVTLNFRDNYSPLY